MSARPSIRSGIGSPALRALPLADHGLDWVHPDVPLAHVLDGGRAALLHRSVDETAAGLGRRRRGLPQDVRSVRRRGPGLVDGLLSPFTIPPRSPIALARYGMVGIRPATMAGPPLLDRRGRRTLRRTRRPLDAPARCRRSRRATACCSACSGHLVGWPMAAAARSPSPTRSCRCSSSTAARSSATDRVRSLDELPPARAVLLDLTPRQVIEIAGAPPARSLSPPAGPVPLRAGRVQGRLGARRADPVDQPGGGARRHRPPGRHAPARSPIGAEVQQGQHPERPFVLLAQQTLFDPTRAPAGDAHRLGVLPRAATARPST